MEYKFEDFFKDVELLSKILSEKLTSKIKYIYGIPRGGTLLGMAIGNRLGLELVDIPRGVDETLVVDDLVATGETIKPYILKGYQTATIHVKLFCPTEYMPSFFLRKINEYVDYWWEKSEKESGRIKENLIRIFEFIGENPLRPGLIDTPDRIMRMYRDFFQGYDVNRKPKMTKVKNGEDGVFYDEMLIDKGYFASFCEHHFIPFFGQYYFGYIPKDWILGTSKIARTVDYHAGKLQIAERLVSDIVEDIEANIKPRGLILVMEARHLCKEIRGVKKWDSSYKVTAVRGVFKTNENGCRDEFLRGIK